MRILVWTDGFWPRLGGIETHGYHLTKELQKRGHQCRVIAQKDHPSWKENELYEGIPIQRFDFDAVIRKRELKMMRLIQEYLEWIGKEFQPDIIHLNVAVGGSAFVFFSFMKMFSVRIVLTVHVPCFHSREFSSFGVKIATSADRIVCVSNWVLDEMKRQEPSLRNKMSLIYNGLPMPSTIPSPLCFSPPTLLLFGRLSPEKGFSSALIAFSLLKKKRSDVRLIIAGDGPERSSLEKLASELGVSQWVEFTGVLPQEKVSDTFNKATLVIVPSIIESFGLVLLESMQMQRPVIASRVEGIPEVVSDGKTGLLVPPQDPSALCEAIWTLLDQPELAVKMGLEGYKKAMQFPIGRNVDQFECLYKELYRAQDGFVNLASARQSIIDLHCEHHSQIEKGEQKNRLGKAAARPNSHNLTEHGISS